MHGSEMSGSVARRVLAMRSAQEKVTLMDEFANTTMFVRTAPYAVPSGKAYNTFFHYNGRADSYFYIGHAMGHAMLQLLGYDSANATVSHSSSAKSAGVSID
jgi:hypothetical protein